MSCSLPFHASRLWGTLSLSLVMETSHASSYKPRLFADQQFRFVLLFGRYIVRCPLLGSPSIHMKPPICFLLHCDTWHLKLTLSTSTHRPSYFHPDLCAIYLFLYTFGSTLSLLLAVKNVRRIKQVHAFCQQKYTHHVGFLTFKGTGFVILGQN